MTPLQKLPKNVGDLGKLIVAKGFKKLPNVQKIAQSGHTPWLENNLNLNYLYRGSVLLGPESKNPKFREIPEQEQEQERSGASTAAAAQEQVSGERFGIGTPRREPLQSATSPLLVAQQDVSAAAATVKQRPRTNE